MLAIEIKGGFGNQIMIANKALSLIENEKLIIISTCEARANPRKLDKDLENFLKKKSVSFINLKNKYLAYIIIKLLKVVLKNKFYSDYYHDEKISEQVIHYLKSKIKSIKDNEYELVIHVREGDYLSELNKKIYINLEINYYTKLVLGLNLDSSARILITSDGKLKAMQLKNELDQFFKNVQISKNELVKDLACMAYAKNLVCANSSFSFIGAVLCAENNGNVYAPNNYYHDREENIFKMYIDKFKYAKC